jgi:hypothetical protein
MAGAGSILVHDVVPLDAISPGSLSTAEIRRGLEVTCNAKKPMRGIGVTSQHGEL